MSIASLYIASSDTVTSSLRWLLGTLAKNPEYQEIAFKEIEEYTDCYGRADRKNCHYVNSLLLECLRMYPVSDSLPHLATEDVSVGEYLIPAGSPVMASYTSVMHNPNNFLNPEKFIPDRFLTNGEFEHDPKVCAFGIGKRNCIGMRIARIEYFTLATDIIRRFKMSYSSPDLKPSRIGSLLVPEKIKIIFESR